jgi:hypothetical protein
VDRRGGPGEATRIDDPNEISQVPQLQAYPLSRPRALSICRTPNAQFSYE